MSKAYIRKDQITKQEIKGICSVLLKEQTELEKNLEKYLQDKYLKVCYEGQHYFYEKAASVLYPDFFNFDFQIASLDNLKIAKIEENFPNEKMEILKEEDYKRSFYKEKNRICKDGTIEIHDNQKMEYFIVRDERDSNTIKVIDWNMKNITDKNVKGYIIPIIRLPRIQKSIEFNIESCIKLWKENLIVPIFESKILKNKYEKLIELYEVLEKLNLGREISISSINTLELYKYLESSNYEYNIDNYMEKLQNIEKEKINTEKYVKDIFFNPQMGHWDLFYLEREKDISKRELIHINVYEKLQARNPVKDIRDSGVVAIDFGTRSTVVAYQESNDNSRLCRIGGGLYNANVKKEDYENPTMMEIIHKKNFLKEYYKVSGRPFTKWEDLKISYDAVANFTSGSKSIISELKQWCGDKEKEIITFDRNQEEIYLKPYIELEEGDFDPIEVYAYYIGSYLNNMHTKNIFLNYILSFPIAYEKNIREKMRKSFEKGLKKSLPISLLEDSGIMQNFSVKNVCSEPTAYFLCAVKEYDLLKEIEENRMFYGVFDFGGGTIDFSFGIFEKSQSRRYDYELSYFGEGGDPFLGGENILQALAYEVFKENAAYLQENKISFSCPKNCESFPGDESLVNVSYEANYNIIQLSEKLRDFWERPEDEETRRMYSEDNIKLRLLNQEKESVDVELRWDKEKLIEEINKKIESGINQFISALSLVFNGEISGIDKMYIFLSGNASNNLYVKNIFQEKIEDLKNKILEEKEEGDFIEPFNIYWPLESKSNSSVKLNGKTGTALGLLSARAGGKIRIEPRDEVRNASEINFKYYVGYAANNQLEVVLDYEKSTYNKWEEFLPADEKISELYYTQKYINGRIPLNTKDVKRKNIIIQSEYKKANIYIRAISPDTIEYAVSTFEKIKKDEYIEEPKKLKL